MKNITELLTIEEASELVGVSKQTLYTWMTKGVLGYVKKGSIRLFDKDAVLHASEIMAERKFGGARRKGTKKG